MDSVPAAINAFPGTPPSHPGSALTTGFLPLALLFLALIIPGGNLARAQEFAPSPANTDPDLSTYRQLVEEQRQIVDGEPPATDGPATVTGTDRKGFAPGEPPGEAGRPQSCASYRTLVQRQDDYIRALERALARARAGGSN